MGSGSGVISCQETGLGKLESVHKIFSIIYSDLTRLQDIIAGDVDMHGNMLVPIILGSDKTTVSVATGQNDYYPLYISIGNVHNNVRRAHRNAVVLLGFLAIPKGFALFILYPVLLLITSPGSRAVERTKTFRNFRQQLFHSSISAILQPLLPHDNPRCCQMPGPSFLPSGIQLGIMHYRLSRTGSTHWNHDWLVCNVSYLISSNYLTAYQALFTAAQHPLTT